MNSITIIPYYIEELFNLLPSYILTPTTSNSFRIEWEKYFFEDTDFERWAIITYTKETGKLFIDFEYNSFVFDITSFEQFFELYFTDIMKFVSPLNKMLSPDIAESLKLWEQTAVNYYLDSIISDEEYTNVVNFLRQKCYVQAPAIVIENFFIENPLLNSLFKNPEKIFPMYYSYPTCTNFFLKFIMPIIYDVIINKKIFN